MGSNYWERYAQMRSSRRRFMQAGAAAGVGAAALGLVGCGDDDDNGGTTPATGGTTAPGASPSAAAVNRGGTLKFPMSGVSSGDPPTLYPFENLTYLAQTPSGSHYSRLLRGVSNAKVAVED